MKNEINAVLENMTATIPEPGQSATAREPPARNGRPPRSGADTLTPWKN